MTRKKTTPHAGSQGSGPQSPDLRGLDANESYASPPDATGSYANGRDVLHVPLYRLAHSRSGDKGDISNLSLIAWDPECYDVIAAHVTAERVREWFAYREPAAVTRYLLPTLHAMNFVLEGVLDGGVNDALNLDAHGKSLSFQLLDLPIPVTADLAGRLPDVPEDPWPSAPILERG